MHFTAFPQFREGFGPYQCGACAYCGCATDEAGCDIVRVIVIVFIKFSQFLRVFFIDSNE